jgi:hypothetical protein
MDHAGLVGAVQEQTDVSCSVFLTETNGIWGFDDEIGKNIELMEKGRGCEYGYCVGGQMSDNWLLGGEICGTTDDFPPTASILMVIADQSGS